MAASQDHITTSTPMGATLTGGGATFRVWAPGARHVHVTFDGGGGVVRSGGSTAASCICFRSGLRLTSRRSMAGQKRVSIEAATTYCSQSRT